jgi:Rrf2 family protein
MISKSSKYAIKAILYLAAHTNEHNKMMVKDIAAPINVPQAYIAKLLQELSKRHIISSTRGPKGGFYLDEINRKKSIMDIIEVIDGEKKFNSCILSLKNCDHEKPCPLHENMYPIKKNFIESFRNKTIEEASNEVALGITFLPL